MPSLVETLIAHTPRLLAIPAVAAVVEGKTTAGKPAILVHVLERTPDVIADVPDFLDGYPVVILPIDQLRRC